MTVEDYVSIRPVEGLEMDWRLDFDWMRIVPLAMTAPQTEYSKKRK